MVSPINGDKPLAASAERSGESAKSTRSEQVASSASRPQAPQATEPVGSTVEVDKARQLYDLESQSSRVAGTEIATPEAARSLLDQILEQFSARPEQAMKSQASQASTPLANLLQSSPA